MSGLVSDEVAEDYKNSLEDLTSNDKFQISNLTVIAKENTEHAMAISRVLENHIRNTPPSQKLPALYVVDSVVKNVGTPYTLFLGRNLYQTFMNAYTLVDSQTRKKLDEMLKTWKEPVPGSLDPRPVFPVEVTRNIENALIKARTAALQQQQTRSQQEAMSLGRGVGTPPPAWRNTPTPPQGASRYPAVHGYNQQMPSNGHGYPNPQAYNQQSQEPINLAALHRDVDSLILSVRLEFTANPLNTAVQQKLKALVDLQSILQQQRLPEAQLRQIRDQVSQLSASSAKPTPTPAPAALPAHISTPAISTPPMGAIPPQAPQPNLQALLNPNTLAELIKATAQKPTPNPQSQPYTQPVASAPTLAAAVQPAAATSLNNNPLIASLRARGLLPPATAISTATPPTLPFIIPGQPTYTPPAATPHAQDAKIKVPMSSASIRIPRPNLISCLYDDKPNRCGTCGRRFVSTQEGKENKARHLDWHFKTNLRMNEAAKRSQNRSWYLDERDWIKFREFEDDIGADDASASASKSNGEDASGKKAEQQRWIHAPNDAALRNTPCPICQENFESTWFEDAQDWIWRDAIKVGNRIYHGSCYAEVTKDGGAGTNPDTPRGRTSTPDSVLGKRKAEDSDLSASKVRIKTEPAS
ncbi:mRNA cleavage factor complex component Pcf11 [Arthroderma uncinatum]|uniref:mRNA cleavage factor complex component Pcf11 n=1 Tax=Arthroderma uncinatum TaxID=74035 RepID=UPI00144ACC15|nr:mRNA cleavage factor complex component Pcf11 [Arthroderma uncinatum]KAF3483559.1 mRNA cleavage factor complex component Pcf11 [Arthroderma uncinatum]